MYEMREFKDSIGRVGSVDNLASNTRNQDPQFPTQSTPVIKRVYSESNFKRALLWNNGPEEIKGERARHSQRSLGWFSSPPSPQLPINMDIRTAVCSTSHNVQHTTLGPTAAVALPIKSFYYMPHRYVVCPSTAPASFISCEPVEKYAVDVNSLSSKTEVYGMECQDIRQGILNKGNMKVNEFSSVLPAVHQHQQDRQNNKQDEELQFAGCVPLEGIIYPSPPHMAAMNQTNKPEFSGSPYPLSQTLGNLSEFDSCNENALYHANSPISPYTGMCSGNRKESPGLPYPFSQPLTNAEPVFVSHNENVQSLRYSPTLYTASHPGTRTESPGLLYQSPQQTRNGHPLYASVNDTKSSMMYSPPLFTTPYCQTRPQGPEILYQLPQQPGETQLVFNSSKRSNEFYQPSLDKFHQNSVIPSEPSVSFVKPRSPLQHNEFPNQALPSWTSERQTLPVPIIQLGSPSSTTDDSPSSASSLPSSSCMCSQCMDRGSPPSPQKSPRKNWSLRKFLLDRMLASSPHSSMGSTASLGSRGSADV